MEGHFSGLVSNQHDHQINWCGALPLEVLWGCATVMTPFFQASWGSPSLPIYRQHTAHVLPFSIFRRKLYFQPCVWPKFQLSRCNFLKFLLPGLLIFLGKTRTLDPAFGNPHAGVNLPIKIYLHWCM